MDSQQNPSSLRLEASGILKIASNWWKPLLIIAAVSAILAIIFSSPAFIKPLFKSTAILYPSNLAPYATENATEQMIQIFESEDILDHLITDFHLFKHYDIDSAKEKYPMNLIKYMMKERIKISKTEFESAELVVFDTDPVVASQICDSMNSYMNAKVREMQRKKYAEVVIIHKTQMDKLAHQLDSMETIQRSLRTDYGIIDFEEQVKPFSRTYYSALEKGNGTAGSKIENIRKNLAEKGGEYIALRKNINRATTTYNDLKVMYDNSVRDLTKTLTFTNVVTKPFPAEKKSYPVRSLIILGFTTAMVFVSFLIIIVIERNKVR
jgi:uncharacterized protein involved in exopolysaccharide biosynthesis